MEAGANRRWGRGAWAAAVALVLALVVLAVILVGRPVTLRGWRLSPAMDRRAADKLWPERSR